METLIGDDGNTYDLPLKVNLKQSRSRDKDCAVDNFNDVSVQINFIVKSYGDALKTSVRHCTKSCVVFGNSNSSCMKGAPEVIFHALVSGIDRTLTEDNLKSFLSGKHIVFNGVKSYSREHSLSNTFKMSLSPTQYRRLQNPKLWGIGITVKRFFERRSK